MNLETAKIAANWWADRLFGGGMPKFDNGGDGTASMLMTLAIAHKAPPAPSKRDAFVEALAESIVQRMTRTDWLSLGVDYGPEPILFDAAAKADCASDVAGRWPWKTDMYVRPDCISVSAGYQAEAKYIWIDESATVYQLYAKIEKSKPVAFESMETREEQSVNRKELAGLQTYQYVSASDYYWAVGNTPEECFERIQAFASAPQPAPVES